MAIASEISSVVKQTQLKVDHDLTWNEHFKLDNYIERLKTWIFSYLVQ